MIGNSPVGREGIGGPVEQPQFAGAVSFLQPGPVLLGAAIDQLAENADGVSQGFRVRKCFTDAAVSTGRQGSK